MKKNYEVKNLSAFDKGQAYYYARTGDYVDINGEIFKINEDAGKIGYTDMIGLTNVKTNRHTQISKKEFVKEAKLVRYEEFKKSKEGGTKND